MTSGVLASHPKRLHQMVHVLGLRWHQSFSQIASLRKQLGREQFVAVDGMGSISVFHCVHDFLSVGVCFVLHVAWQFFTLIPFPELHDGLVGLPGVDICGRSIQIWVIVHCFYHPLFLVRSKAESLDSVWSVRFHEAASKLVIVLTPHCWKIILVWSSRHSTLA